MIETCNHPLEIFIAESRALDGGKPYVLRLLKAIIRFILSRIQLYIFHLRQCDGVFIGAETYYSDGRVINTVGTEMVASVCNVF